MPVARGPYARPKLYLARIFFVALALASFAGTIGAQAVPTQAQQETQKYAELPNFRQVGERLYRGGQPLPGGVEKLAALGVNTIINLRRRDAHTRAEEAAALALGMRYFNLEMPAWGRPTRAKVGRVLGIIEAPESGRVFVHCRDGVDRTGTIVACYRIAQEGWAADEAVAEARRMGMRGIQFWMRDFVEDFGERRGRDASGAFVWGREDSGEDFRDRLGAGARVGELGLRKGQSATAGAMRKSFRAARHAIRKGGGSLKRVFAGRA